MVALGEKIGQTLSVPSVIELKGDVGSGKTTLTQGLATGLGITEPVTSPSFTISKRYQFNHPETGNGELVHYDFYRLNDLGIMSEELAETLSQPNTITVIEWGNGASDLLPAQRISLKITLLPDGTREIMSRGQDIENLITK